MPKISLITPGGGRPQAFALCEKYMQRCIAALDKDIEVEWIVADDNVKDPVICTMGQKHIYGDLQWRPGINTLRYNLDAGLKEATGDYIFIIENDDAYREKYLLVHLELLKHSLLTGFCDVTYYNIGTKSFFEMKNQLHASTCCTAFRKEYIPQFYKALHSGEQYFDITCWSNAQRGKHDYILFSGMDLSVGMKGLPGRSGVGWGHQNQDKFTADTHFVKLKQLLGDDAKAYIDLVKQG